MHKLSFTVLLNTLLYYPKIWQPKNYVLRSLLTKRVTNNYKKRSTVPNLGTAEDPLPLTLEWRPTNSVHSLCSFCDNILEERLRLSRETFESCSLSSRVSCSLASSRRIAFWRCTGEEGVTGATCSVHTYIIIARYYTSTHINCSNSDNCSNYM